MESIQQEARRRRHEAARTGQQALRIAEDRQAKAHRLLIEVSVP